MKNSSLLFRQSKPFQPIHHGKPRRTVIAGRFSPLRRFLNNRADDPNFLSIVDNPPKLVKVGQRNGPGLILLGHSTGCVATTGH